VSGGGGRVAGTSLAHEGFKPRVQRWRTQRNGMDNSCMA